MGATVSGNDVGGSIAVSTAHPSTPAWLTGGTFGPEASVLALLLVTTVTLPALSTAGRPTVSPAQESGPVPNATRSGYPRHARDLVYTRRGEEASGQVDHRVALSRAAVVYAGPVGSP